MTYSLSNYGNHSSVLRGRTVMRISRISRCMNQAKVYNEMWLASRFSWHARSTTLGAELVPAVGLREPLNAITRRRL